MIRQFGNDEPSQGTQSTGLLGQEAYIYITCCHHWISPNLQAGGNLDMCTPNYGHRCLLLSHLAVKPLGATLVKPGPHHFWVSV